ncbi:hypothetical protein ACVWZK_006455 [Bradyrhizobium sp. GM0.4]
MPVDQNSSADIVEAVTDELLAHGEFSSGANNRSNAREAARVVVDMVRTFAPAQTAIGCGDPSCKDPNCDYGKHDDALRAEVRSLRIDNARLRDEAAIRALTAQPPVATVESGSRLEAGCSWCGSDKPCDASECGYHRQMRGPLSRSSAATEDDLPERLLAAAEGLHMPPSIQSQRNIRAMNACDEAATEIKRLRALLTQPQRDVTKWPDTLGFDDRDKYIDELEAQIERNRAAPAVNNKDLLNWIENEASRGLSEGDAREALTAIKWKIKDVR